MEHYERSTKRHRHHKSRDSVIGRSVASDRATQGSTVTDPLNDCQVEDQRGNLRAVQEALDAAYDRINDLEANNASMNESLTDSNRENRALKKEKIGLIGEKEDLLNIIENLNKRLTSEASRRSPDNASTMAGPQRRPSIRQPDLPRQQLHTDEQPHPGHDDKRSSMYERTNLPFAPKPPLNPHTNPFAPRTPPMMTHTSIPPTVPRTSNISRSIAPLQAVAPHAPKLRSQDDGKYHLGPL
ncbi:hypothetical protein DL98DRAFT_585478 [Cadophora sp. DSE1049]|nr:hypothetical protein DL98DRAFT_585478 [Cadophora sp. DSE1049]